MPPFGHYVGKHLLKNEMTQRVLAVRIGIPAAHLSMILNGIYLSRPKDQLVEKIIEALKLNRAEAEQLKQASEISERTLTISKEASTLSFKVAHRLMTCINNNETEKLERISKILKVI